MKKESMKKKSRRCQVYYLPIGKHVFFRLSFSPKPERALLSVAKVKFTKDGNERLVQLWRGETIAQVLKEAE